MENKLPEKFIEFKLGWYRNYNFKVEADLLLNVLNNSKKENDIQKYIKDNEKWFIPASIFKEYNFGHHEAYIVPEQSLGSEYRVDYMLLGKNSIGHQIVLVEFEDVNVDYKIQSSNMESTFVRKGMAQINDWKRWMDKYRDYFLDNCGLNNVARSIPSWGIHYCLVVSRRELMDDNANILRGHKEYETPNLKILTYDRIVDNVKRLGNGF